MPFESDILSIILLNQNLTNRSVHIIKSGSHEVRTLVIFFKVSMPIPGILFPVFLKTSPFPPSQEFEQEATARLRFEKFGFSQIVLACLSLIFGAI